MTTLTAIDPLRENFRKYAKFFLFLPELLVSVNENTWDDTLLACVTYIILKSRLVTGAAKHRLKPDERFEVPFILTGKSTMAF